MRLSKKDVRNDLTIIQHAIADAKLIDDIALFAGGYAHFLSDILHVDLQLLDASIIRISPDCADDGGIRQHLSRTS